MWKPASTEMSNLMLQNQFDYWSLLGFLSTSWLFLVLCTTEWNISNKEIY
jgi:hypothetical protein